MNIKKIFFSFAVVIVFSIASEIFTILKMDALAINTQKLYTHPFKVSNAVADIQTSVITIHRNIKDVISTSNTLELLKITESIQHEEEKVYHNFEIIYKNYLGNKRDIDTVYKLYQDWKPVREELFLLAYDSKIKETSKIAENKNIQHVKKIYKEIKVLRDYANTKADEFYTLSIKNNGITDVVYMFILTLILSGAIVLYIVRNLLKISKTNNKQLHLIDQNILTATLLLNKEVVYISNALCYVLGKQKKDILHTKDEYLFTDFKQFTQFENKIYSGKVHKGEVYLLVNNEKTWFNIEIFPELNANFELYGFNIFLTNISDKKKIEEVSIKDVLTGLYNRNYFELIFDKELKRAKRDKKELSMLMFDVDYFKQYNDTYGHQEGDNALKAVAAILSKHTNRSYDYAFRVGGEEFVILSYQKDFATLEQFADTILKDVEALKISHKNNNASNYLTLSAGVMLFGQEHLLNTDEMYKEVDKLLYKAKENGRNNFKISQKY